MISVDDFNEKGVENVAYKLFKDSKRKYIAGYVTMMRVRGKIVDEVTAVELRVDINKRFGKNKATTLNTRIRDYFEVKHWILEDGSNLIPDEVTPEDIIKDLDRLAWDEYVRQSKEGWK